MPQSYFDGLEARRSVLYKGRQRPNERSKLLSKETIVSYGHLPNIPFHEGIFVGTVRRFLGDTLCDELGVPRETLLSNAAWYAARGFFVLCCVLNNLCSPLKAHVSGSFIHYINNAFLHYFVLSKAEQTTKKMCPFGF